MKGITGIELILIGLMFTFALLLFFLIPIVALRVHLVSIVEYENKYNNALLTLVSFFPTTQNTIYGKKTAAEIIGNHLAIPQDAVMGNALTALKVNLNKLHGCFKLVKEDGNVVEPLKNDNCDAKNYETGKVKIALPYNPDKLVDFVKLVID